MLRLLASTMPFFVLGALVRPRLDLPAATSPAIPAALALVAGLVAPWIGRAVRASVAPRPLAAALAAGVGAWHVAVTPPPSYAWFGGAVATAEGRLERVAARRFGGFSLELRDARVRGRAPHTGDRLGDLRVVVASGAPPPDLLPGQEVRARGWLAPDGARLSLRAAGGKALDRPKTWRNRLLSPVAGARARLSQRIDAVVAPRTAELLCALLLGQSFDDAELERQLRRAGATHLFAVSGLHLGLLALVLLRTPVLSALPRRARPGAAWMGLAAYALVTGARPPVMRALLLVGLGLLGRASMRPIAAGWLLLTIAAGSLLARPHLARDLSFLLSFSAVAGIVWIAAPGRTPPGDRVEELLAHRPRQRAWRWLAQALAVSYAALVATAPWTLTAFGGVAPATIIASVCLLPLVAGLLLVGPVVAVCPPAAPLADGLAWCTVRSAELLSDLPGGYVEATRPAVAAVVAHGLALLATAILLHHPRVGASRPRRAAARALPALTLAGMLLLPAAPARHADEIVAGPRGWAVCWSAPGHDVLVIEGSAPARRLLARAGRRSADLAVATAGPGPPTAAARWWRPWGREAPAGAASERVSVAGRHRVEWTGAAVELRSGPRLDGREGMAVLLEKCGTRWLLAGHLHPSWLVDQPWPRLLGLVVDPRTMKHAALERLLARLRPDLVLVTGRLLDSEPLAIALRTGCDVVQLDERTNATRELTWR